MARTMRLPGSVVPLVALALVLATSRVADSAEPGKPAVSVDDIAKAWEARAARVRTLRIKWHDRYRLKPGQILKPDGIPDPANPDNRMVPEKERAYEASLSVAIDGDCIRYERNDLAVDLKGKLVPQETIWVWTQKEYRQLWPPDAIHYPSGHLAETILATWQPGRDPYLMPLLMTFRPFHPALGIFENFKKRFRVAAGTQLVNGRECIQLEDEPLPWSGLQMRLYLDPSREFLIIRKTFEKKGAEHSRIDFLEFQNDDHTWVPLRWKSTAIRGSINGSLVSEFTLNAPVDPETFKLEFPAGTWVHETARPTTFIVREGGIQRTITDMEASKAKRYEDFLTTNTGELAPGPDTTNDKAARAAALADHRRIQLGNLRGRLSWSIPIVQQDDLDVRVEPVGTVNPREPIQVAVTEASSNQMLYGRAGSELAARNALSARLQTKIEGIGWACVLTAAQKATLDQAGRADIARLLKRARELRPQILKVYDEKAVQKGELDPTIHDLCEASEPIRRAFDSDAFEDGSDFAKTLKTTLTAEQAEKLRQTQSKGR